MSHAKQAWRGVLRDEREAYEELKRRGTWHGVSLTEYDDSLLTDNYIAAVEEHIRLANERPIGTRWSEEIIDAIRPARKLRAARHAWARVEHGGNAAEWAHFSHVLQEGS